jgi:hypothetical protein
MWLSCGRKHQQPTRNADLRGQPGPLGANRVLDDLHHQGLPLENLPFDGQRSRRRFRRSTALNVAGTVPGEGRHEIGNVQESGALQTDVDERRLHSRQHPGHLAQVHVAHQSALQRPLDVQFLDRAVFDDGHPGFLRRPIDQDVLLHTG